MNAALKRPSLSKRGVAVIVVALLGIGALGLGTVQGAKTGKALTPKAAKKQFFTKKAANGRFYTKDTADERFLQKPRYLDLATTEAVGNAGAGFQFGNGASAGISMPGDANSVVMWSWTLPDHYPAGTAMTITFNWNINNTGCGVNFQANSLSVRKAGAVPTGNQGQVTPQFAGETLNAPATGNLAGSAAFTIPGTVQGQQVTPNTNIAFSLFRNIAAAGDTCAGGLQLNAARVTW